MLERFRSAFGVELPNPQGRDGNISVPELQSAWGGLSVGGGLYRIHSVQSASSAKAMLVEAFPEFAARNPDLFGFDWLGRQFALDKGSRAQASSRVLLFEPGTGQVLEIPLSLASFLDEELVDFGEAALATSYFESWKDSNPDALRFDQCVGYRVPLFMGGADDNLELSDLEVYWSLTGQLRLALRDVPGGSAVGPVSLD